MATSLITKWTVLIDVEEDESLTVAYRMTPDTKLAELMAMWKDEFDVYGHWVFVSANEKITYNDNSLSLEMVGESAPSSRTVTLRAKLTEEPINEIFANLNDCSHHAFVKPHEKVYELAWRLPGRPECLAYDGALLNPGSTLKRAGMRNKAVIYEPLSSVTVKLSTGAAVVVQLPLNSLVLHLKEEVNVYEADTFSLSYRGRYLKCDERIRQLKGVVEVKTAEFVVNLNNRRISWTTKREPIAFSEFVSQLGDRAGIDTECLKMLDFRCVGCQRRICHSEDYIQHLPVKCCKEKSLTLDAVVPTNIRTDSDTKGVIKLIQNFHDHLTQYRLMNLKPEESRSVYRTLHETFAEEGLNFSVLARCNEKLLQLLTEFEEKIQALEVDSEALNIEDTESRVELGRPQAKNTRTMGKFKKTKKELGDEHQKLHEGHRPVEAPQGATGAGPSRLPTTPDDQSRVKVLVFYPGGHFSPANLPDVEDRSRYSWSGPFIRCQIRDIRPGLLPFEELRAGLQRILTGPEITEIEQWRGWVGDTEVAEVTTRENDHAVRSRNTQFCDVDGAQVMYEEAKPSPRHILAGGRVLICGGGRRTVLGISSRFR